MTRFSTILVAGGATLALALSTGSAWAPIYFNNAKVTTPKVTLPKVKTPQLNNAVNPQPLPPGGGGGTGKLNTPNVTNPGVRTNPKALNPQPLPPG